MIRYFNYDQKSLFWVRFSAYFFTYKLETVDFFTINPYFWTPKIGLSEAKLAMNDYFVKLSPTSVSINPVIWSRLF